MDLAAPDVEITVEDRTAGRVRAVDGRRLLEGSREMYLPSATLAELLQADGYPLTLAEQASDVFRAARNRVTPYAEVVDALALLRERYVLVSVTNGNSQIEHTPLMEERESDKRSPALITCLSAVVLLVAYVVLPFPLDRLPATHALSVRWQNQLRQLAEYLPQGIMTGDEA